TQAYTQEEDIDLKLANKIKDRKHIHYIMISSRAVYGDAEDLQETNQPQPTNNYGQSKLLIEKSLTQLLGEDRLTILRCSNVFGEDAGEHTFIGKALSDLKKYKKIVFHMSKETKKDFVPVKEVCRVIKKMAQRKLAGVYNVGLGVSTKCGDIAEWLILGYGQGSLEVCDNTVKGQFFMDTSKVNKELNLNKRSDDVIEQKCMELGRNLK
ncbi:MAG: SDR family oxidoreductase, partial [Alphaproteobacteria bacterium]|nr:SDR family oxidoreductase [Alphaproteobacteria bacterium]